MSTTAYRGKARQASEGPSRVQRADAALEQVIALFESGELPERVAQTVIARQAGDSPLAAWSLGNQLLALLAGTGDARGFRQWEAVGRHVVKGAKAFYILAPSTRKVTDRGESTASIVLCSHDVRTFFHELAHAAHEQVLQARGSASRGGQVASQEIVAETCAATLCHLYGLYGYLWHGRDYVASYSNGQGAARAALRMLSDVQQTLRVILEGGNDVDQDA